jgi:hypothetical protein
MPPNRLSAFQVLPALETWIGAQQCFIEGRRWLIADCCGWQNQLYSTSNWGMGDEGHYHSFRRALADLDRVVHHEHTEPGRAFDIR